MGKQLTILPPSATNDNTSRSLSRLEWVYSNLIAVLGYEFWNPLSTIQVGLESLAPSPALSRESPPAILETAMAALRSLHQLIEDCLSFSQVEVDNPVAQCVLLHPQASSQQMLRHTLLRISSLHSVETDLDSSAEIVNFQRDFRLADTREEVLEHMYQNLRAIIGHEIRTPLCTLEICLESLSDKSSLSREDRQEMLALALHDLGRLQKLIKDFLLLERLERGQIYHRSRYVSVREVVDLALTSLKARQDWLSLPHIVLEIPAQLPLVKVDEDILVEALIKLLDNACKFTSSQGEIKIQAQVITAQARSTFKPNTNLMLEIAIADNGRGIAPHHLEAIFNCFYQEENFLRRTVNGAGMGLTICRHLLEGLGGEIWADSPGKNLGSSIHFTLPLVD